MRLATLIGLVLLASVALGATTITSTATAATPELLPGAGTSFTMKGGKGAVRTLGGKEVKCEKNAAKGEVTSTKLGIFELKIERCTAVEGGIEVSCTGLGDTITGNITVKKAEFHVWGGLLSEKEVTAFVVLFPETVHFTCGGLVLVNLEKGGCLAGLIKELDKLVKTLTVVFSESAVMSGDPDIPFVFENLKKPGGEKEKQCTLGLSANEAKAESLAIKQEDTIENFVKEGKEVTVLIDS